MVDKRVASERSDTVPSGRARIAGSLFIAQISVALVTLPVSVVLARNLGPGGVGDFQFINRIALVFVSVACLGFPHALAWAANAENARDYDRALVRFAFRACLPGAVLGALGGLSCALLTGRRDDQLAWLIYAVFPASNLLMATLTNFFRGKLMVGAIARTRLAQALLWLSGCLVAAALGYLSLPVVSGVMVMSQILAVLVAVSLLARGGLIRGPRELVDFRPIRAFSARVFPGLAIRDLNVYLDQIVIGLVLPRHELGIYAVAVSLTSALGLLSSPIVNTVQPIVQRASQTDVLRTCCSAVAGTFLVVGGPSLALVLLAGWGVPKVYGAEFSSSIQLVQLLSVAALLDALNACLHGCLLGLEKPGRSSLSTSVGLVATLVFLVILLPSAGVVGAAIASIISYGTVAVWMFLSLSRVIGVPLRTLMVTCVRLVPTTAVTIAKPASEIVSRRSQEFFSRSR